METVTGANEQTEVSLRTLSSDITSAQHGAALPVPEQLKVAPQTPRDEDEGTAVAPHHKTGPIILLIIILAIAAALTLYLVNGS